MQKNPLDALKQHFFRSKHQTEPQTDPRLEAAYQSLKGELLSAQSEPVSPERLEALLRQWWRMTRDYARKEKAEANPYLMRTARTITYNLCPDCQQKRSQRQPETQQPPNPYKLHLEPIPQQNVPPTTLHAQLEARKEENRGRSSAIRRNLSNPSTAHILPAVSPQMAHEIQQMNALDISQVPTGDITPKQGDFIVVEDKWLNSQPVTTEHVPVVEDETMKTETGIPALQAYLKHTSRRG